MMPFCRKFRVWGVSVTLFFFMTVFIPGQAKANPLALIPIAAIGTALALGAGVAGQYYAPAVWQAGDTAASNVGNVARKLYYGQKIFNSVAGNYFWGKATSAVAHVGNFLDWLGDIADQIPNLWQQIQDSILGGFPYPSVDDPDNVPALNDVLGDLPYCDLRGNNCSGSITARVASSWTTTTSCTPYVFGVGHYFFYNNTIKYIYSGDKPSTCTYDNYYIIKSVPGVSSTDEPTVYPPVFDPDTLSRNWVDSPGVAEDVDKVINHPAVPPGLVEPVDTPTPAIAAGGTVTAPPAAITPTDIERGLTAVRADISRQAAETTQDIADSDPTNLVGQQIAVDAQKKAAQDALEAENEVPELPNVSATSESAYTLPEVDFAARFQTFLANIKSSSVFAVINNLNLPIGTGESLISFDFGSWGGVQSLDFADYADVWLILRGIFFAVFCFISTRIVILKR